MLYKRFHEITKLGWSYSPFFASSRALSYKEAYKSRVYTCVTQIANSTAKLPFHLLNDRDKAIDHEYLKLITYPLLEWIVSFLKLNGTCFIWKNTIGWRVRQLVILRPDLVETVWDNTKSSIKSYKYNINGKIIPFKAEEIIAIHNFSPLEAYPFISKWFSDIQAVAVAIDTDNAASTWNWKFFENSANPGFILETESAMTPEVAEWIYQSWVQKFWNVNNSHKPAILTGGLKARQISPSQREMDFVEQRKFSRDEILAVFKVPKAVLGLWDGTGWNLNIRPYQEIFYQNAIEPLARRIQDAFNKDLFVWLWYFEFYNIIPKDEKQVILDYNSWIITLNEARSQRGYIPLKNWDVLYWDTPVTTQAQPTKSESFIETKWFDKIVDNLVKTLDPGERKIIKRDKRLLKYENQIKNIIWEIAQDQEKEILSLVEEKKELKLPKIDLSKYNVVFLMKLKSIYIKLVKQEWEEAIKEVESSVVFQTGAPEVTKFIKDNIYLLSKSVNETTKTKLEKIFEEWINEWIWANEMKTRIKDSFEEMKSSRAEAIARTESIRMSNEASIEGRKQSWVVKAKKWWTAQDDRVASFDKSMHGKIVDIDKKFFKKWDVLTVDGQSLKLDYSDTIAPPLHVNCRCTLIPVLIEE